MKFLRAFFLKAGTSKSTPSHYHSGIKLRVLFSLVQHMSNYHAGLSHWAHHFHRCILLLCSKCFCIFRNSKDLLQKAFAKYDYCSITVVWCTGCVQVLNLLMLPTSSFQPGRHPVSVGTLPNCVQTYTRAEHILEILSTSGRCPGNAHDKSLRLHTSYAEQSRSRFTPEGDSISFSDSWPWSRTVRLGKAI